MFCAIEKIIIASPITFRVEPMLKIVSAPIRWLSLKVYPTIVKINLIRITIIDVLDGFMVVNLRHENKRIISRIVCNDGDAFICPA